MNAARKALWALAGLKSMDGLESISGFHLTGANRIRAGLSRQDQAYWCGSCDREKVRASMTCSDCGKKDVSTRRMKKGDNF